MIILMRRFILNLILVIFILVLIERCKSENYKSPSSGSNEPSPPTTSRTVNNTSKDCTTCILPKRCKPDEILESQAGECCPRCVCKKTCPELDYDICTRGFKPQLQKASVAGAPQLECCDRIICVSASTNDELTISVKETGNGGNDFYIDEADENSVEAADEMLGDVEEDDLDSSSTVDDNASDDSYVAASIGKDINLNSFQYDSNQVLDDFTPSSLFSSAETSSSSTNAYSKAEYQTRNNNNNNNNNNRHSMTTPSVNYYDEQIKIDVKAGGSNGLTASENEYYLDEKEYGNFANMTSEEEMCNEINCLEESFTIYKEKLTCPDDSLVKQTDDIEQHCCQLSAKCECAKCEPKPNKSWCKMAGNNFEPILVRKGESIPGKCCDIYICHTSNYTCNFNGAFYSHNAEWKLNACTQCRCDMGYITCKKIECPILDCEVKEALLSDECCPVCTGECRSASTGLLYKANESWKEDDDCTECRCVNGRTECVAELCQPTLCRNPIKKPGLCCRVCEAGDTQNYPQIPNWQIKLSQYPPHCKTKIENLKCPAATIANCKHGPGIVELDGNRCPTCRCASPDRPIDTCSFKCDDPSLTYMPLSDRLCRCTDHNCPATICSLQCSNGYQKNVDGCDLCICKKEEIRKTSQVELQEANYCHDRETGAKIAANGNVWYDGCRQCLCLRGVEYCSLISCKKQTSCRANNNNSNIIAASTQWLAALKKPNTCCPVCPFSTLNETTPTLANTTICRQGMMRQKQKHEQKKYGGEDAEEDEDEEQTWKLDKCTKCMCRDGVLLCSVNKCPPVTCSKPVYNKDECCPQCPLQQLTNNNPVVVRLSSSSSSSVIRRWSCIDSNENYREHGAAWKETDCLHCVCHDGDVKCFNHETSCPSLPQVCKYEVRRKGECCPQCLDNIDLPYNLSIAYLNTSSFLTTSKNSPLSNKILLVVLSLALILFVLFIIVSVCFIKVLRSKRNASRKSTRRHNHSHQKLHSSSTSSFKQQQHHHHPQQQQLYQQRSRPGSELIVHVNDDSQNGGLMSVKATTRSTDRLNNSHHPHHHHHHHHHHRSSINRLSTAMSPENYSSTKSMKAVGAVGTAAGVDVEFTKPLLGPKKYVINSRTNLNTQQNNSGSEISETTSTTNNDENSKSTLLTGFSDLNNSATRVALPPPTQPQPTTNSAYLPVNNQICYF